MKTDTQLQHDVVNELEWEPSIDGGHIGVIAHEGVVTLTGHVPVYAEKHTAEDVTKRVHGVRAVANEIEVRPSEAHTLDDEEIAAAAVHALQWDADVPDDRLKIAVMEGWIRIEGTVAKPYQKAAIDRAVRHLRGARGMTNDVVVAPPETMSEIEAEIRAAFERSAVLNSKRLAIEVEGNSVTLTGDVHSHAERGEAERTAWCAPGVRCVRNCLTITPWGFGPAEEWGY